MKKLIFLLVVLVIAVSCSTIRVSSDYDKTAGFSVYKTYSFTEQATNLPVDDINKKRILSAIETELAAKGFTKTETNPDVLIDLNIKTETKEAATATTTGGYYGRGYRYGYGAGMASTSINYENYTEGTLFIDMIDASRKQLIWQGRGTKTLDPDSSQKKREENINYAVKQIFMKYPPKM